MINNSEVKLHELFESKWLNTFTFNYVDCIRICVDFIRMGGGGVSEWCKGKRFCTDSAKMHKLKPVFHLKLYFKFIVC